MTGTMNNNTAGGSNAVLSVPITIANTGVFNIDSGLTPTVNANMTCNGTINIAPSSTLSISSGITVTCAGNLNLTGSGLNIGTIIGAGTLSIVAGGTLTSANPSGVNTITATTNNSGAITTTSGSLTFQSMTLTHNTGGTYTGTLNFNSATFFLSVPLTFGGTMNLGDTFGTTLSGPGPLTLTGTMNNNTAGGSGSVLSVPITIANTGVLNIGAGLNPTVNANMTCNGTINIVAASTLSISSAITVTCAGNLNLTSSNINGAGTLSIASGGTLTSANPNGTNTISATNNNNSGTIISQSGTLDLGTSFAQAAGITSLSGGNLKGILNINGGSLTGAGTITGDVANAAAVSPGTATAAGTLTITGKYSQTAAGTLNLKLGGTTPGTQFDTLAAGGASTLGGTLAVTFINGFTFPASTTLDAISYASKTGSFATVTGTGFTVDSTTSPAKTSLISATPNPVPTITTLAPNSAAPGGAAFSMLLTGTGFFNGTSTVQWNASNRTTTFVSATQLIANITAADIATAGSASVTVTNSAPGGGTSAVSAFAIGSSSSPASVSASFNPAKIGDVVTFAAIGTDPNNPPQNCAWNFGDGITTNGNNSVTHAFSIEGTFTVSCAAGGGTAQLAMTVVAPNSGGIGVANVNQGIPAVANPLNGININTLNSEGGVIELGINIDTLNRAAFSVQTSFSKIGNVILGSASGLIAVNKFTTAGIYVAKSTATDIATTLPKGSARKTMVVSRKETGETPQFSGTLPATPLKVTVKKTTGKFSISSTSGAPGALTAAKPDVVTFQGTIELPAGLDVSKSQDFWASLGNIVDNVTIDAKGRGGKTSVAGLLKKVSIKYPKVGKASTLTTTGQTATVSLTLSGVGLVNLGFSTEGVGTTPQPNGINIQLAMLLAGAPYEFSIPATLKVSTKGNAASIVNH